MPGPRLLISGYYGFGNTGDEAILQAMVAEIRRQSPQARLAVLTADAQAARSLDLVPLHRRRLSVLVPAIRNCDLVLSGGGGLVQDSTGVGTVAYYLGITTLARLLGRPCMLFCQGFGPVRTAWGRRLVRLLGNLPTLVTVRDPESAEEMRQLGVRRPPLRVCADPALLLEPASPRRVGEILAAEGLSGEIGRLEGPSGRHPDSGPLVAVCLRPWPGAPLPAVQAALARFAEAEKARYVFVPFQADRDLPVSRQVAQGLPARVLERPLSPAEILGVLGCMDMVLGMRLHSLIFAASRGIPLLGLSYDPKVERFARRAGGVSLPLEGLAAQDLAGALGHLLAARAQARQALARRLAPMRAAVRQAVAAALALAGGEPVEGALALLDQTQG